MKHLLLFILMICMGTMAIHAQERTKDSVQELKTVVLFYKHLKDSVYTTNMTLLQDSILKRNPAALTNMLNYNSTIYFKENGLGMVSSPSFRGTTAQQTAVFWNGININSQTTGQTDFNTINTRGFDAVIVKAGGSGVIDGSNAIGGSVYLENSLSFKPGLDSNVFFKYGSFTTYDGHYKLNYASKTHSLALNISRSGSDNDYPYQNSERHNLNGQFNNTNISFSAGARLNKTNELNIYANIYDGKRNFSLPTPNALKTKYYDFNTRSMLEWKHLSTKFKHITKFAVLTENYQYFPNINSDYYTEGYVESVILKYDVNHRLSKDMLISSGINYLNNNGKGTNIKQETRQLSSVVLGLKHQVSDCLFYEIGLRQELNKNYDSPFLYSLGFKLAFSNFYSLKINTSKNFRIPTYNDLYWQGVGNPDLKSELSYQGELSQVFKIQDVTLSLTGYYNAVKNLLMWVPDATGVWRPENTNNVEIYGVETLLTAKKKIANHELTLAATYAYTVSKNSQTGKQLIYVPYHKFTTNFGYAFKKFSVYYQYLNNGEVFTTTDNTLEHIVNSYMVGNLGLEYTLGNLKNKYVFGVQAVNLWNESYESVTNRPMPGRNYNAYINFKF